MARLIHRAGSCENGPCPNVFDVAGDGLENMVGVQGAVLTDPPALAQVSEMPAEETIVLIPRQVLREYLELMREEEGEGDS